MASIKIDEIKDAAENNTAILKNTIDASGAKNPPIIMASSAINEIAKTINENVIVLCILILSL